MNPARRSLLLSLLPTIVVLAVIVVLMRLTVSTHVAVRVQATRIAFTIRSDSQPGYLDTRGWRVRSVTFEEIDSLVFLVGRMEVADPRRYQLESDTYPPDAWRPLVVRPRRLVLRGDTLSGRPRVTLGKPSPRAEGMHVAPIIFEPGVQVTLSCASVFAANDAASGELRVTVRGEAHPQEIEVGEGASLVAENCVLSDIAMPFSDPSLSYRFVSRERNITVATRDGKLSIAGVADSDTAIDFLAGRQLSVTELRLQGEDPLSHDLRSTLVPGSQGMMSYLDFPEVPTITLNGSERLSFG
jgi:hypothetical protein